MNKGKAEKIFKKLAEFNPEPKIELNYVNEYTLLVAIILSAQSTDKGVNKATKALFKKVKKPDEMLDLGEKRLIEHIKTIGLYRNKAKNVIKMSQILVKEHLGKVPKSRDELLKLPGVGRKTANVFLNSAFDEPFIGVDTHILRISNRIGFSKGTNPEKVEEDLAKIVPKEYQKSAGHQLVLHGRYVCKAKKPECYRCPIVKYCEYKAKNL